MKNIAFILLFFTAIANAQIINIPDANFKVKLLASSTTNGTASGANGYMKIDANNDGQIEVAEALPVTALSLRTSNISSLAGIEYFTNLTSISCDTNQLTSLDLSMLPNLERITCSFNQLTSLDLSAMINLHSIECKNNQLTSLIFPVSGNFGFFDCSNNQLTNLNLVGLPNLSLIICTGNQLTSLDMIGLTHLSQVLCADNLLTHIDVNQNVTVLECTNNLISSLDLSNVNPPGFQTMLVLCSDNPLTNINLGNIHNLATLDCSNTLITELDISNQKIDRLKCNDNPNLTSIFLKGSVGLYTEFQSLSELEITNNPNLHYICASEEYFDYINEQLIATGQSGYELNSYCSFTPGGNYNSITGNLLFDYNSNGCDAGDFANPYIKMTIDDTVNTGATFTNATGNYTFYTQTGNFTVSPQIENPSYFTVSPNNATVSFPLLNNSTQTLNFCIAPNGTHPDLEVVLAATNNALPGFDANYKMIYRNKGTQTQSGNINLTFEDDKIDLVSANPNTDTQSVNQLIWNFSNLQPFETRSIDLVFNINSPTENPAVNSGDHLHYNAVVSPFLNEEDPTDNVFNLDQLASNSQDPNNKTCLEGNTITPNEIGKYVHYNINFENIGTADATNVVIKDMIDTAKFNVDSLQLLYASHTVETKISENKVEFVFRNINLPPSNLNPIGGHGNVLFKIKTLDTLTVGDQIANTANIFFDYNAPIFTNEARTTIAALANDNFIKDESITIAPNPTQGKITVASKNNIKSMLLFDVQGRLLQTVIVNNTASTIDISNQANGIYFLKVISEAGSSVEKIMKEN